MGVSEQKDKEIKDDLESITVESLSLGHGDDDECETLTNSGERVCNVFQEDFTKTMPKIDEEGKTYEGIQMCQTSNTLHIFRYTKRPHKKHMRYRKGKIRAVPVAEYNFRHCQWDIIAVAIPIVSWHSI